MSWSRRKKQKNKDKTEQSIPKKDHNITIYDDDKYIEDEIYYKRRDIYSVSGVDKADYPREVIKKQSNKQFEDSPQEIDDIVFLNIIRFPL